MPCTSFNSRPSCDGRPFVMVTPESETVSIHARLATGDYWQSVRYALHKFQFTPVLRRATLDGVNDPSSLSFNSRPSCDGRHWSAMSYTAIIQFQFTPVLRRATGTRLRFMILVMFQFTPVLRRATLQATMQRVWHVSIHARLATGDFNTEVVSFAVRVSIHARLATGDR